MSAIAYYAGHAVRLAILISGLSMRTTQVFPLPNKSLCIPGGISETEILLAYGGVRFASKVGQLAGNHFLTIVRAGRT
jgi:hypothetical protein